MKPDVACSRSRSGRKTSALVAALSLLLAACSGGGEGPPVPSTPITASPALESSAPRILATPTYEPTPTFTEPPPSVTPTTSPTATSAPPTVTSTPAPLTYYFPVQPSEATSYTPGHSGYPAMDIFAPEGSLFVAVTSGVVDFVRYVDTWDPAVDDPDSRGGLAVAIIGDDGIRYYGSHLSSIAPEIYPGAQVYAGQLLGTIGKSGNARETSPHLHFGISRPTYPEDWAVRRGEIDPYPYLQAWQYGVLLAPALP